MNIKETKITTKMVNGKVIFTTLLCRASSRALISLQGLQTKAYIFDMYEMRKAGEFLR